MAEVKKAKKTEPVKKAKEEKAPWWLKDKPLGHGCERMIEVKVLKDFEGHKKGDTLTVPERKCRDSNRNIKRGYYKPV